MTDRLTPAERAEDARRNYEVAVHAFAHRNDRVLAGKDQGYVTITQSVVNETVRIVTRPATPEELAQLEIAQGIVEAEDAFARPNRGLYRGLIQSTSEKP